MAKFRLLSVTFLIILLSICPVNAISQNLTVSEDAYIDETNPNLNYGSDTHLYSMWGNGNNKYPFLKFNVPEYAGEAYLHIYTDGGYKNAGYVEVRKATSDWSENTITWSNQPGHVDKGDPIASASLPINNQWIILNVSSVVKDPANYTFWLRGGWGYNDDWVAKEGNSNYRPYLEIRTSTRPTDINWNNYTNNDSKAFLVNTGDIIKFNISAPDSVNISNYSWYVNKTVQPESIDSFNFTVPSFDGSYPSTGIWEVRVEGNYINGSKVTREWLISGLTIDQAPDFLDSFIDIDNRFRSGYIKDPWGREFPYYYSPTQNVISNGYLSGTDSTTKLQTILNTSYGTFKYKLYYGEWAQNPEFKLWDAKDQYINCVLQNDNCHDYFSVNSYLATKGIHGTQAQYIPISRRCIGQAPGAHRLKMNCWYSFTIVRTPDDWIYLYENDSLLQKSTLHAPDALEEINRLYMQADGRIRMDNVEIYKNKYIYPETEIRYGQYPYLWQCNTTITNTEIPLLDNGVIVFGRGLTLKQISDGINNASLMTYDDNTRTATLKTNLFVKAGAELNITNETLIFDTSTGSKFINLYPAVVFRVQNSTVTTNANNPLIWDITSSANMAVDNPEHEMEDPRHNFTQGGVPAWSFRGRFIIENSTINNTCNLYIDGAHEVRINDTIFSNMSRSEFGDYASFAETHFQQKKIQSVGNKSFWFVPREDLAAYSIRNISFVNPKIPIDLKVIGGEFQFNDTIIKDCDFSNVNVTAKKAYAYWEFNWYNDPWENVSLSLLNCKFNESNFTVETDRAKIKTRYYADIVVKDSSEYPVEGASINFIASNETYRAENIYNWTAAVNDGDYGPGIDGSGAYPAYNIKYSGGAFYRWFNAYPLGAATTNADGRTSLPSEDVNNTIVLTDKVWTNEVGVQSKESIRYSLKVSPPDSEPFYIQDVDPDSNWYRENPLSSEYTITAIIPDNSTVPHITGFAPSEDNPFEPGEEKIFRVWTDENLTEINWTVDGDPLASGTLNYTWIVTEGYHEIRFSGKNEDGNVSQVWEIGKKFGGNESDDNQTPDDNQTSITEFLPESTALTRNTGELVIFNVISDQLLDSNWFVDGELASSGNASITQNWNTPGTYNVTFSGSTGGEQILHVWIVDVTGSPEPQNESIVRVDPEYQVVSPGEPFTLEIRIEPGTTISGAQFDLSFKDSMVRVDAINEGNLLSQNGAGIYFINGTVSGSYGLIRHVYGSILGELNVSAPGTLAVLNLTASNSTGVAEFNLSNVIISDTNSSRVPNSIMNSTFLIDTAPEMDLIGSKSVNETENLTFRVNANDEDGDVLAFSASGLPEGADFDPETGIFTWIPSKGQAGTYTVTFEVSDGYLNDSENAGITVIPSNNAPSIISFKPANGSVFNEGENITIAVNASDSEDQVLSYVIKIDGTVYSSSPGCVWNTNYSSSGSHTIELIVSDGIEEVKEINTIFITDSYPRWDVNQDGVVDIRDVTMVSRKFGTITKEPYPKWDVNQDGIVDTADLDIVNSHFGEIVV
ncbi:DUF7594 domain-containing protein [Methanosarcina sp.]|uniref:CBM96 family carbohydrate-binding protein n=1 Tax=Methanosarcina sp. TaxID=2213 RepID=UPI003C774852